MTIVFCNICGKPLLYKDGKFSCSCGFSIEKADSSFSEKGVKKEEEGKGVWGRKSSFKFPHDCPKCGHDGSEVIDLGAPYSDESNVYLFICGKCGYVDRQADGSSNG